MSDKQDIEFDKEESSTDVRIITDEVKGIIARDEMRLIECINKVIDAIKHIRTNDITETDALLRAAGVWIAHSLGLNTSVQRKRTKPWWKRRI